MKNTKWVLTEQGIAGDTNSLVENYFKWANIDLGNFMTYNSYVNEKNKQKVCDLRYSIVKHSDFRIRRIRSHMTVNISFMSTLTLSLGSWKSNARDIFKPTNV